MRIEPYVIDSAVAIPKGRNSYPLNSLEVGESFVFLVEERNSVQSAASTIKRKTGKVFTVKKESNSQCRCWRTE